MSTNGLWERKGRKGEREKGRKGGKGKGRKGRKKGGEMREKQKVLFPAICVMYVDKYICRCICVYVYMYVFSVI